MYCVSQDGPTAAALVQATPARVHSGQAVPVRLHHRGGGLCAAGLRSQLQHHRAPGQQDGVCHHSAGFSNCWPHSQMCLLQVK